LKIASPIFLVFFLITTACSTLNNVDYPSYRLNDKAYEKFSQNKSVYIAPIEPLSTRVSKDSNFREVYGVVQAEIESYMKKNGFNVLPSEKCESTFNFNMAKVGGFFNQETGKMDPKLLSSCVNYTIADLKKDSEFSAIVIPILFISPLELQKPYTSGTWEGVKRRVKINTSPGRTFSPVQTMSVRLIVVSSDGELIFNSVGGIDFIQKVIEKGSVSDRRIALVLKEPEEFSIEDIHEGIEIAFHPFISCQRIGDAKEKV
jgi:hypothetical protein